MASDICAVSESSVAVLCNEIGVRPAAVLGLSPINIKIVAHEDAVPDCLVIEVDLSGHFQRALAIRTVPYEDQFCCC